MKSLGNKKPEESEFVSLRLNDQVLVIGTLTRADEGHCIISGVAQGLTFENYDDLWNCREMSGFSDKSGEIWLDKVSCINYRVSGDERHPNSVIMRAETTYCGDFHPARSAFHHMSTSLDLEKSLIPMNHGQRRMDRESMSLNISLPIQVDPTVLFENEEVLIEIWHYASLSEFVTYEEKLTLTAKGKLTYQEANKYLDTISLLLAVLTQAPCYPRALEFSDSQHKRATEHRRVPISRPTRFVDWLEDCTKIASTIQRMLPAWIKALENDERRHLCHLFVDCEYLPYAEERFLRYCQCFEGLNRVRVGNSGVERGALVDMVAALHAQVQTFKETDSKTRRKLKSCISDALRTTLEGRMRSVFISLPYRLGDHLIAHPKLFEDIAARRNRISHGAIEGSIHSNADFKDLLVESAVIRALTLAEIVFMTGSSEKRTGEMICLDKELKHVNPHRRPSKLKDSGKH